MTKLKIVPFIWYVKEAEEAARFYTSIFPDSKILHNDTMPGDSPSGPEGSVKVVEFQLAGQTFRAMTAGPLGDEQFNHRVSLVVDCADQAEVDRYWELLGAGGSYEPCGWLRDRFGLSWQITPTELDDMMRAPDRQAAARATAAMLKMKKLDLAELRRAFAGKAA